MALERSEGADARAAIDTSRRREFRQSPWQMLKLGVMGVGMTALCGALGLGLFDNAPPGSFGQFVGLMGLAFFGLCTGVILWRLATIWGPVVVITPEGIRDTRVAAELIPWTAVEDIGTWQSHGQKILVLAVDPAVERKLHLTRTAAWTRGANRSLGADGLCIATTGLNIKHEELITLVAVYAEAARLKG